MSPVPDAPVDPPKSGDGTQPARRLEKPLFLGVALLAVFSITVGHWLLFGSSNRQPPAPAPDSPPPRSTAPPAVDVLPTAPAEGIASLHEQAQQAVATKDYNQASLLYKQMTESDPQNPGTWNNLGAALLLEEKNTEAIAAFDKAIALNKADAEVFFNRATANRRLSRLSEAIADQSRAVQMIRSNDYQNNRLLLLKIEAGFLQDVRDAVRISERAQSTGGTIMAAAALDFIDGNTFQARGVLEQAKMQLKPTEFRELLSDPVFEPYRRQLTNRENQSAP